MSSTTILTEVVLEHQTGVCAFLLTDENGDGIDAGQIETMTLTYYDKATGEILNTRQDQDAYNTNNVTITTDIGPPLASTVTWEIQPEDAILMDSRRELEAHIALFQWTWDSGNRHAAYEVQFNIEQITYV